MNFFSRAASALMLCLLMTAMFTACSPDTSQGATTNVSPSGTLGEATSDVQAPSGETPSASEPSESTAPAVAVTASPESIVYENTTYGFDFILPETWEGYTVLTEEWEARDITGEDGVVATGPELLIRSPKWTEENPTQDIPIMIFTPDVWEQVLNEQLAVSAAPVPPSELGRNSKYVFALPPRYNFAYLPGWEDVQNILDGGALNPTESFN